MVRWLPAFGVAPAPADEATGRAASERHTRTGGGMKAESGAWPWQVALVLPRGSGFRQFCGGFWNSYSGRLRSAHRDGAASGFLLNDAGFRVARTLTP